MALKLEHVHLKTRDPQGVAKFYREALGARLLEASPSGSQFRLDLHGMTLNITDHLAGQSREQRYGIEHFALQTDDLEGSLAKLQACGARVLEQVVSAADGTRVYFLEGPQQVQLELIEMKGV